MLPFSMVCPAKSKFNFHVVLDGNYKLTCRQTELVNYFFFKIKYFENILARCHKPANDAVAAKGMFFRVRKQKKVERGSLFF
jgi:hypothetical protein